MKPVKSQMLSVVIPVYNEQKTVAELLNKVLSVKLPVGVVKEVIVVNDGSKDKTAAELAPFKRRVELIEHEYNQGKGAAVRTGFKQAKGDFVLIQDADLEYNPEDFSRLLEPVLAGQADAVYGTRLQNYPLRLWGSRKTPMPIHWISNHALTWLTNLFYGSNLTDMETCYKLIKRPVVNKLGLRSNRFDIEPEITAKLLRQGYKIVEVPIKVKPRGYRAGKKIGWKDGVQAIWSIIKFRFND